MSRLTSAAWYFMLAVAATTTTTTNSINTITGVQAFVPSISISSTSTILFKRNNLISSSSSSSSSTSKSPYHASTITSKICSRASLILFSNNNKNNNNNNNNNDDENKNNENSNNNIANTINQRIQAANLLSIRRDIILVTSFVLCRYFLYDVSTGSKLVPGFELQDIVYLTGTLSSAALLGAYWTMAGLLTRLFEVNPISGNTRSNDLAANAVNVGMCCPLWIATEHALGFGPVDVGGVTLDASVVNGWVGLTVFVGVVKSLTKDWR